MIFIFSFKPLPTNWTRSLQINVILMTDSYILLYSVFFSRVVPVSVTYLDDEETAIFGIDTPVDIIGQNYQSEIINPVAGPSTLQLVTEATQVVNVVEGHMPFAGNRMQTDDGDDNRSREEPDVRNVSMGESPGGKTKYGGPPGFITTLVMNFNNCVVNYLDYHSREAVQQQKEFVDPAKFGKVKTDVVNRVIELLLEQGDCKTVPSLKFFDNIVDVLGLKYPAVFGQDPTTVVNGVKVRLFSSRGTGGVNGIKGRFSITS